MNLKEEELFSVPTTDVAYYLGMYTFAIASVYRNIQELEKDETNPYDKYLNRFLNINPKKVYAESWSRLSRNFPNSKGKDLGFALKIAESIQSELIPEKFTPLQIGRFIDGYASYRLAVLTGSLKKEQEENEGDENEEA